MCGLAGWIAVAGASGGSAVDRMVNALRHRGPDDLGIFSDGQRGVAIGHCRLSIIDLSAASHQPMVDEASGVVLAFNGELYNFQSLRRELEVGGHVFRSSGDTEVVLRSFLQWGVRCLDRFAGMFAIAIWDPRSSRLHLARDAMGMKPLYYWQGAWGTAFASEVKAFLEVPGFEAVLDSGALQQYLEFGYVFDESRTMLQGLRKLNPGERISLREGRIVERETWFTPPCPDPTDQRQEADRVAELRETLQEVLTEHLISDVPLGLLLSGGLDSSVVAALAARKEPITTICMGFGSSTVDEREYSRQVADHIGSNHLDVLITASEVKDEVRGGVWVFDDLFADWGTLTTRILYRRCREQGIKVVLVGEGADELFGGYDIFNLPSRLGLWQLFLLYRRYAGRRYGRLFSPFWTIMTDYLSKGGGDAFHAVRLFESRRQLPNQYVMKVDKASMAESVEARAPYLDRRIAELAYRTPREWLLRGGANKYLLRAVGRDGNLLPEVICSRRKFGAPLDASWMDDDAGFRSFARNQILAKGSHTEALGLAPAMRAYFDCGLEGYGWPSALSIFRNLAWRLLLLELWGQRYLAFSR